MAYNSSQSLTALDYKIACICPMGVELAPVEGMLDQIHAPLSSSRDQNAYTLGNVGAHNIVVAVMPEIGNNMASATITQLLNDFPAIRFGLLVGIGGGVPGEEDVRLGDVVVGQPSYGFPGVIQYDMGKSLEGGQFQPIGSLNKPPAVLSASVRKLEGQHRRLGQDLSEYITDMFQRFPRMRTEYSIPASRDQLFQSTYIHSPGPTCDQCNDQYVIKRSDRSGTGPRVHYGNIGSANMVVKDASIRDRIRENTHALCIEMEAAGLANDLPCLIIRGICDYADSHKNKAWQPYAAAVAAAYMKAVLSVIPVQDAEWTRPVHRDTVAAITIQIDEEIRRSYNDGRLHVERLSGQLLPLECCFISLNITHHSRDVDTKSANKGSDRYDFFAQLCKFSLAARLMVEVHPKANQVNLDGMFELRTQKDGRKGRPNRILIWGRAGMGKTTLCKKIVHEVYNNGLWKDLYDRVIWLPLRKLVRSESRDIAELMKSEYPCSRLGERSAQAFYELAQDARTLFLLDGLDEVSLALSPDTTQHRLLRALLSRSHVIITSRPHSTNELDVRGLDLELETTGFLEPQIKEYLRQTNPKNLGDTMDEIWSFIKQRPLVRTLAAIPIQLDAICYTWNEESFPRESATMASLYLSISKGLWKNSALRLRKQDLNGRLITRQQLDHRTWRYLKQIMKSEIEFLGELAFRGLYQQSVEFNADDIEIVLGTQQQLSEHIVHLSFLRSSDNSVRIENNSFYFIHLTFQEFFAAQHFISCWVSNKALALGLASRRDRSSLESHLPIMPEDFVRLGKYVPRYDIFWRFVVGLLQGEQDKEQLCRFLDILEDEPVDIVGPAHHELIIHCLSELNQKNHKLQQRIRNLEDRSLRWIVHNSTLVPEWYEEDPGDASVLHTWISECSDYIMERLLIEECTASTAMAVLQSRSSMSLQLVDVVIRRLRESTSVRTQDAAIRIIGCHCRHDQEAEFRKLLHEGQQSRIRRIQISRAWQSVSELLEPAIEVIIQLLSDTDTQVRRRAAYSLENQAFLSEAAHEKLVQLIHDPVADIQHAVSNALGNQASLSDTIIGALMVLLRVADRAVSQTASRALSMQTSLPESAIGMVTEVLKDPDERVRCNAITVFSNQAGLSDAGIQTLIQTLQDPHSNVRQATADVLGSLALLPDCAIEALVQALRDVENQVRDAAARAMKEQAILPMKTLEILVRMLRDPDAYLRWCAVTVLSDHVSLPDYLIEELLQTLEDPDEDIRRATLLVLEDCSPLPTAVMEAFCKLLLHDPDEEVQWTAAEAIGRHPHKLSDTAIDALVQALQHSTESIRQEACHALSRQATLPDKAIDQLILALQGSNRQTSINACSVLAEHVAVSETAMEALLQVIQDSSSDIRCDACSNLGFQDTLPERILEALTQALQDPDPGVKLAAASALSYQANLPDSATEALLIILQDPNTPIFDRIASTMFGRREAQVFIPRLKAPALQAFIKYWIIYRSEACFIWKDNFCMVISGQVKMVSLQPDQLKQFEAEWQIAKQVVGLQSILPISSEQ